MPAASQQALAYSPLGHAVAREVQQFIQQGGGAAAGLASPQAQWMAMQATRQLQQQAEQAKQGKHAPAFAVGAAAQRGAGARARGVDAPSNASPAATPLKPEQQAFLRRITPWAEQAAEKLGVSVRSVMAHAALESGWGQRPVRTPDGRDTLNLFGFKAMGGWTGDSVQAMTTEYADGEPVKQNAAFRAYADLDDTFADYVRLLGRSPRYSQVRNTGDDVQAFAQALVQGGYATDPAYADKLVRLSRSIPAAP